MAVVKKYNPNKFYYSDRITEKMSTVLENKLSVVEAPTGFGKTTTLKKCLEDSQDIILWITIENPDENLFYDNLCEHIKKIDADLAQHLASIGCPTDTDKINKIAKAISEYEIKENYIFVLDNYQFIDNPFILKAVLKISELYGEKIKVIVVTQNIKDEEVMDAIFDNKINYVGKNDLEFNFDEIKDYFRECGIMLDTEEVEYLFKYTEGWISAIYLQMLHYVSDNKFEEDAGIDKLVCNAIWDKLTIEEQDFLISMSIYDSFSLKHAYFIGEDSLEKEEIKKLLSSNSFIRYDSRERKYFTHSILKYFLNSELEKLDIVEKKLVYEKAAKWYSVNEMFYMALYYYYKINKFDEIYELNISMENLIHHLSKHNRDKFVNIVTRASLKAKEKNIRTSILFSFVLFIYNEKEFFENECNLIREAIEKNTELREREKNLLIGETYFINGFLYYNDIEKILEYFEKSYELMKSPTTIFTGKFGLLFRSPSVLGTFHSNKLDFDDEIVEFEKLMVVFYKITSGSSKGLEAVMRAEMLYNQGNFDDAEVLCQKALYMAETRNQANVYICTMFLLARISIFRGDYDNLKHITKSMDNKVANSDDKHNSRSADICYGFLYSMMGKYDKIPKWLTEVHMIEERNTVFTLAISNVIYGKYVISKGDYTKFLGISGQLLGSTRIFNNGIYEIYIYIYIAIANYKLGNKGKALKFLNEAIDNSKNNNIYMPFVENIMELDDMINKLDFDNDNKKFLDEVKKLYHGCEKGYRTILNMYKDDVDFGLTNREFEIAKLAAKRYTNKEIAAQLYLSTETVKSNLKTTFAKLGIKSRSELGSYFDD